MNATQQVHKKVSELREGDRLVEPDDDWGCYVISDGAAEQPDGSWSVLVRTSDGYRAMRDWAGDERVPVHTR